MPVQFPSLAAFTLVVAFLSPAEPAAGEVTQGPADVAQPASGSDAEAEYFSLNDQIDTGFVLVDGAYLEPPYTLECVQRELIINGVPTGCLLTLEERSSHRGGTYRDSERRGGRRFNNPLRPLAEALSVDALLLLLEGTPPVVVDVERFLEEVYPAFVDIRARESALQNGLPWLPAGADQTRWTTWLSSFTPPAGLTSRVDAWNKERAAAEAQNTAQIHARHRLETWAYPLSTLGLILVVIALGHLLSGRPQTAASSYDVDGSLEALRAVNFSVLLILALSALDLVWTLLAAQAGGMKELNPLGSRLIHDPDLLIGFKLLATFVAVGIVLVMRRFRRVQLASWWMCLICTVLAVRWLTFNSMFV